jgi:Kef-type K+ transport system membrane component KefB
MDLIREQVGNFHPNTIMVFGVLLLFGVAGGLVANRVKWMPTITAFMTLGAIIGPHGLGLITKPVLSGSLVLIDIALGLILYRLGSMLHPRAMLKSRRLMATAGVSISITFICTFALVVALGYNGTLAALIGAIAVSSSPSVLVHVADELGAKGPITDRAKSLVTLNNLASFLIFSLALPFAMITPERALDDVFLLPLYQLALGGFVGVGVAWMAHRITRLLRPRDEHYRFAIVIGAVMLALGLSSTLGASSLFAPLVLGVATRGFETSKANLTRQGLGEGGDLFYIILFVMAGAKINFAALVETGFTPFFLFVVRTAGIFAGVYLAARLMTGALRGAQERMQFLSTSLLLVPMAGMAIGLVVTLSELVPEMGYQVSAIVYAMVALFETVGPFAAMHAFRMAGEVAKKEE